MNYPDLKDPKQLVKFVLTLCAVSLLATAARAVLGLSLIHI